MRALLALIPPRCANVESTRLLGAQMESPMYADGAGTATTITWPSKNICEGGGLSYGTIFCMSFGPCSTHGMAAPTTAPR